MPLKLCEKSDVEDIWSEEGVEGRFDDGMLGALTQPDNDRIDRFIYRASAEVAGYLRTRYKLADFAGSSPPTNTPQQVKSWAAIMAAYYSGTRRGLSVPQTLIDQYKQVLTWLQQVKDGMLDLGEVNDSFDHLPTVTNFVVDGRYRNAKVRRTQNTSTGDIDPSRKQNLENNPPSYPFD